MDTDTSILSLKAHLSLVLAYLTDFSAWPLLWGWYGGEKINSRELNGGPLSLCVDTSSKKQADSWRKLVIASFADVELVLNSSNHVECSSVTIRYILPLNGPK